MSQCNSGDIVCIRQVYTYTVVWNGKEHKFLYYTNIPSSIFLSGLLTDLSLQNTDIEKYRLFLKNQLVSVDYQFPFDGVSDVIYLEEKKGIYIDME